MSYFLADADGYIEDFASIGGLKDFFDWAQTQEKALVELVAEGMIQNPRRLVEVLNRARVPSNVQEQVEVLKRVAPTAREILIISDGMSDVEPRQLARREEGPLHATADQHVSKLSVAVRYAFSMGRRAYAKTHQVDAAVSAIQKALKTVLPGALRATYVAGGQTGAELLGPVLRAAGGAGSGNFGHAGRPGQVGGSADGPGTATQTKKAFPIVAFAAKTGDTQAAAREFKNGSEGLGVNAEQLSQDMSRVAQSFSQDGETTVRWDGDTFWIDTTAKINGQAMRMQRSFTKVPGGVEAHHDFFNVPKDEQHKGIAAQMLADSLDVYQRHGITSISTTANLSVGGYAWAKLGFEATYQNDFHYMIERKLQGFDHKRAMEILDVSRKAGAHAPFAVASLPEGKQLLLGAEWEAHINLSGPNGAEFKERIRRKGKKE